MNDKRQLGSNLHILETTVGDIEVHYFSAMGGLSKLDSHSSLKQFSRYRLNSFMYC